MGSLHNTSAKACRALTAKANADRCGDAKGGLMANATDRRTLDALTKPFAADRAPGSTYEDWLKRKVSRALAAAKANPDRRVSQDAIWKDFGLED